jgi:uncharacterized protein
VPRTSARTIGVFAAAVVAGVCGGLVGIGGGTVLVPLLVLVFGFDQQTAQGTSLVALVPPTGLLGFLAYYNAHEVNIPVGLLIIPGVFFGAILGSKLANALSPLRMRAVFALFLFLLGVWQIASLWIK